MNGQREEVPLQRPEERRRSPPCRKGSNYELGARCGRVVAVHLEGPLEVADNLAGTGSRADHQAESRTLVQTPR
jgi:hypothetical protein